MQSKGLSRVFSNTTVQKHQFFSAQSSLWSNSHIHAQLLEKTIVLTRWTFVINSVCVSIPSTLSYLFSFFLSLLLTLMCSLNPFRGLPERPSSALLSLPDSASHLSTSRYTCRPCNSLPKGEVSFREDLCLFVSVFLPLGPGNLCYLGSMNQK